MGKYFLFSILLFCAFSVSAVDDFHPSLDPNAKIGLQDLHSKLPRLHVTRGTPCEDPFGYCDDEEEQLSRASGNLDSPFDKSPEGSADTGTTGGTSGTDEGTNK